MKMKWNESGFRPPLCTYRLNWARRTSWGWWDDWDDTVLQTQDSKFEPWRSEAEYATSRSRRLPTILTFTRGWGRNNFVSFKPPRPGTEPRTLAWKAAVLTTTLGPPPDSGLIVARCSQKHAALNHHSANHQGKPQHSGFERGCVQTCTLTINSTSFNKVIRNYNPIVDYSLDDVVLHKIVGGGPRVVVSTAAFHARVRGSVPGLGGLKETKNCFFPIHVWKLVLWGASVTER